MPKLSFEASEFKIPYQKLNGFHTFRVSKQRCLKVAQCVGIQIFSAVSPASSHAVALATYKAQAIKCAIDFTGTQLTRPKAYKEMDSSEKANISYWIGMTFSTLIADELLGVARLIHASSFEKRRLARINPKSRSLADLVGQDSTGEWHVFEAKARQAVPTEDDRSRWKKQATTIEKIDGKRPVTKSYSLACVGDKYFAELVDPSEEYENISPTTIDFEQKAIITGYYGPISDWFSEQSSTIRRGDQRLTAKLAGFNADDNEFIFLGLDSDVIGAVRENMIPDYIQVLELEDTYIGRDGIAVITSRNPELR